MTKYDMQVSETQLRVIQNALEEYFRLRVGQVMEFTNDIAEIDKDLSAGNPEHKAIFDHFIHDRDMIDATINNMFKKIWPPYGTPKSKSNDAMIAEDIWDTIRCARGVGRYKKPLQISSEPLPDISELQEVELQF